MISGTLIGLAVLSKTSKAFYHRDK